MDVSLKSIRTAFENLEYQEKTKDFHLFTFILVTPADPGAFKALLTAFDDIHHLTSNEVLIVGPQIEAVGGELSRKDLVGFLDSDFFRDDHGKKVFAEFKQRQAAETYELVRYTGISFDVLPCLAFFDRLLNPSELVIIPFGFMQDASLVQDFRRIMTHLFERCGWRTKDQMKLLRETLARPTVYAGSLIQGVENDRSQLSSLEKRLRSLRVDLIPTVEDYASALEIMKQKLDPFLQKEETTARIPDDTEMIRRLRDCKYDEWAMERLRLFRSKYGGKMPKENFEAIHRFYQIANDHFRKQRLMNSINNMKDALKQSEERLAEAEMRERKKITERLETLEAELNVSAVPPLQALCEIQGARLFTIERSRGSMDWRITPSDVMSREQHKSRELPARGSLNPNVISESKIIGSMQSDVVVLTAVKVELESVLEELVPLPGAEQIVRLTDFDTRRIYYAGCLGNANVVVTMSRMGSAGRSGSIISTYKAILAWKPRFVVMVGIAFGRDPGKQQLGDVLVSSIVHCYELQRIGAEMTVHRGPSPECGEMLLAAFENLPSWPINVARMETPAIRGLTIHDLPARPPSPGFASASTPVRP